MRKWRQRVSSLRKPGIKLVVPQGHWRFTFEVERLLCKLETFLLLAVIAADTVPSWQVRLLPSQVVLMHKALFLAPLELFSADCRRDCRKRLAVTIETQLKWDLCSPTAGATDFGALAYGLCSVIPQIFLRFFS